MKKRIRRNADDRLRRYWDMLKKTPQDLEVARRYVSELLKAKGETPDPHEEPRGGSTPEQRLEDAVRRFQQRDFSRIPIDLIQPALDILWRREIGDPDLENVMPVPNSGSVWLVTDNHTEELITAMLENLSPYTPEDMEDVNRLVRRFDLFHLELAQQEDEDEDEFFARVYEAAERVYERGEETLLNAGGWRRVAGTDFYAIMCQDEMILSYDVGDEYDSCWVPLYHAMGLDWHTDQ